MHRILIAFCIVVLGTTGAAACGNGDAPQSTAGGAAGDAGATSTSARPPAFELRKVGSFDQPVHAMAVPGTDQIAVVEKGGRVRVVSGMVCSARDKCPRRPITKGVVVLDIAKTVSDGSEQGLLGFAFHPEWPDDQRVFVDYTDRDGATHIEAWNLATPTGKATRERELMRIAQPYGNHNGGHLAFGPDGLLYIATGDGGSGGDPEDRAQSEDERLGKLLRVDVDAGGERGFGIPKGNLKGGAPEVWALGLRNPWRFSFDRKAGDLWIGDVGQDAFEEIDTVTREALSAPQVPNFEWRIQEGFEGFDDTGSAGPGTRVPPVLEYGRDKGCSVTGGVVYRGSGLPSLNGWYLFADFCTDDLRFLRAAGVPGSARERGELAWVSRPGVEQVASFGETARGEVLVVSLGGSIHQLVASAQ